jgi:pilus assembly protein CpaC
VVIDSGAGRVFRTREAVSSLFAADPKVVEVRPASHNSVFIFGVGPGRSTVAALNEAGDTIAQFDVLVRPSPFGAGESSGAVRRQIPDASTQFSETPNSIVVTGHVPNPLAAEQVAATARGFLNERQTLDNRTTLSTPVQITLRVRIAEISRSITRQLGINWTAIANFGHFNVKGIIADGLSQTSNLPNTVQAGFNDGTNSVNTILDLLAEDQLITVLAEPNLTTRSGETASFLAGGEYPIPISGQNGQLAVEFKQYGVSLAFVPTLLSSGRISLHVHPEVSELTTQGAITVPISTSFFGSSTVTIPALTVRRADTTVELGSGQSFAVAGLLQSGNNLNARGLPGLGELPVIGALFKSDLFQRNESELVIVVTPYIVRPVGSPDQIRVPTDGYVPPGDVDRVLLNRQRARGTGPGPEALVIPSSAALDQNVRVAPADLPSGVGFILH